MEPIWINKIDVAKKQITEAVKLFFENRDPVVIHTVIASAHQILIDVGKDQGITSVMKNPDGLTREQFRNHDKIVNRPYIFFKHADNDPDGKLNIAPIERFMCDFILDSILMFQNLSGNLPLEAKVFWSWFIGTYPDEFDDCPEGGAIKYMINMGLAD